MSKVFVKGQSIFNAAIAGAKRGYNRSTNDYSDYEKELQGEYQALLNAANDDEDRASVFRKTKGDWRNAYFALNLIMIHRHIGGEPSEPHARVYLHGASFDIPMDYWEEFVEHDEWLQSEGLIAH